jgi:hypothetical protein
VRVVPGVGIKNGPVIDNKKHKEAWKNDRMVRGYALRFQIVAAQSTGDFQGAMNIMGLG